MKLALPLIGGMMSQNILNLVDALMVGRLGDAALAATGIGGFFTFMGQAFIIGLAIGVQAITARRFGEGRTDSGRVLNHGLLLTASMAIPLTFVLWFSAPFLFPYLNDDPQVIQFGLSYYRIRILGTVFVGFNFAFRGFFSGINQAQVYFKTLLLMHILNALLNAVLIFGLGPFPALGVEGAAWGSMLSMGMGSLLYFFSGIKIASKLSFLKAGFEKGLMVQMLKLSLPTGIQQFFFASGLTALYWIVGKVGTAELAASNIMITIMLVMILPSLGLGLAGASLVGQSLGEKNYEAAFSWGIDISLLAGMAIFVLSLPLVFFPSWTLGLFLTNDATVALAITPLRITGMVLWFDSIGLVLQQTLLGAGDSKRVSIVSISTQWLFFLPIAYIGGVVFGKGLLFIWVFQMIYRALLTLILGHMWLRRKWQKIKV